MKPSPPEEMEETEAISPQIDINLDDDLDVSEINLDDDDDIFKSARIEPVPASFNSSRANSKEPAVTDIPLEDDEHSFKPDLQLSGPSTTPATIKQQTLTSLHEV